MSDNSYEPAFDADSFMARYAAYQQRGAELNAANKLTLFTALSVAGITSVTVTFDGSGDSGQIESVAAKAGDVDATMPESEIEIATADFHRIEPERLTQPLAEAIETLAYAFLEETHGGWENNEGAYGEFVFDVAAGTISLDYNERIETSENYTHEF
ncbi:MAG: hypothetical protein KGL48_13950 [Sphingomonadales bacterium]|nr:hypothetical protein [Sphingomonadales bacterium]